MISKLRSNKEDKGRKINEIIDYVNNLMRSKQQRSIVRESVEEVPKKSFDGIVRWFDLTDVSSSPMEGTEQRWNGSVWVDARTTTTDIYPHPETTVADYETGIVPVVAYGGKWFAIRTTVISAGSSVQLFKINSVGTNSLSCYKQTWNGTGWENEDTTSYTVYGCPMFATDADFNAPDMTAYQAGRPVFAVSIDSVWVAVYSQPVAWSEYSA